MTPAVRVIDGLDALEGLVDAELGPGDWVRVSQADVDAFAELTGDRQWIHVDPARAAAGPFGTAIVHGYLALSLLPALSAAIYRVEGIEAAVNYGLEKVRFTAPLPVESRVRAAVRFLSLEREPGRGKLRTRVKIEAENVGRPVVVAEPVGLLLT